MTSKERKEARYLRRKQKRLKEKEKFMQEYDNFDKVFTFEHLWKSYKQCVKGVGWKASTQKYKNKPITNLARTFLKLKKGTYKSAGFYEFSLIERGKLRHIQSVHISERVVQRCFCDYSLVPAFRATLIYDNGASLKNKGIDFTKNRTNRHLQNYYRKHKTNNGYALMIDYSSYFNNILHQKVEKLINTRYTDIRLINLYMHFVKMFGEKGLGLGSQISQISAIAYPNKIDNYIKSTLKIKYYARYMDDSYLLSSTKKYLQYCLKKINKLCSEYGIKLNKKKTQIIKLSKGLPFLKQRFILTNNGKVIRIPAKQSVTKMRKKLKVFSRWVKEDKMPYESAWTSYQSWRGHLKHSNAYYKLKAIKKYFIKQFGVKLCIKF